MDTHSGDRVRQLESAYRATTYAAHVGDGIALRIGRRSSALDALLARHGADEWAFISAWNPGSVIAPHDANERSHARLLARLADEGCVVYEGVGIPDGEWPAERSLLAIGLERGRAVAIADAFGQCAIVAGRIGEVPELVWCRPLGNHRASAVD